MKRISSLSWRLSPFVALSLALLLSVSVYAWPPAPPITPSNLAPGYSGAWPSNDGAQLGAYWYDPGTVANRMKVLIRQVRVNTLHELDGYRSQGWQLASWQPWGDGTFLATLRIVAISPMTMPVLMVPGAAVQNAVNGCACAYYQSLPWWERWRCPGSSPCS